MLTYNKSYDGGTFESITVQQLEGMYSKSRSLQLAFKEANDTTNWIRYTKLCVRICRMISNKIISNF